MRLINVSMDQLDKVACLGIISLVFRYLSYIKAYI